MGSDLADFIMASGAWRRISKAGHMTDTDPADFHPKILAIREPSTHEPLNFLQIWVESV